MKITVDIDCTADEARRFLGLPDVAPMQETLMAELGDRLKSALSGTEPDALLKAWLPAGLEGFGQMQKAFWSQMGAANKDPDR